MKLIYEITVFSLISTLSLCLISNLFGEVLIRGQRLKEGDAYFKVKEIHHIKQTSKLCFCPFQQWKWNSKPRNQKKKKKGKHQNINNSFIAWLFVKPYHMNSYEF